MTEQQRQTDNMLLEMIQRHFPSLPLDDRYTDWQKWLGFARAAYEAGATTEREACAKVCEAMDHPECWIHKECAEAIRVRSNIEAKGPRSGPA